MKSLILLAMVVSVVAPVFAHQAQNTKQSTSVREEYAVYQCSRCKQTRQVKKSSGSPSPFSGICIDDRGKKQSAHSWSKI